MKNILFVGLGGFLGSVERYLISKINIFPSLSSIPINTLITNVVGSLLLGFLAGIALRTTLLSVEWRMFLMVGFCGGFTTFSTFTNENLTLMKAGEFHYAFLYTGLSITFGFIAVYIGYLISKIF